MAKLNYHYFDMDVKYQLFRVTYSDVGFREHRRCRYRLDILINNERQTLYYESYKNLLSFIKSFTKFLD